MGPGLTTCAPAVSSPLGGMARIGWTATSDQDNENLTYRVYRDGDMRLRSYEVTRSSLVGAQPMGFVDPGCPQARTPTA